MKKNDDGLEWYCLIAMVCVVGIVSCSPVSQRVLNKQLSRGEQLFSDHIGLVLYDLEEQQVVFDYQGSQFFTPASNTKVLTFFSGLCILGDSIPGLQYAIQKDTLFFWGTGDPTFLHRDLWTSPRVFSFLKESPYPLVFSSTNFTTTHFGPGWSWEDYNFSYSCERTSFPIYGNTIQIESTNGNFKVNPAYFSKFVYTVPDTALRTSVDRIYDQNLWKIYRGSIDQPTWAKPFKASPQLIADLLSDTLKKPVGVSENVILKDVQKLNSVPVDSVYRVMMQDSDNFVAEQLLLMCSGVLSDSLAPEIAISYMLNNQLRPVANELDWRDGSGLSRYNLVTPKAMVWVWNQIYQSIAEDRLFHILPAGGVSGTIKNYYQADRPYIYGKTGTLSHVHCLSGFLITKKQKKYIFALMNTNYRGSSQSVKNWMEGVLRLIHERY